MAATAERVLTVRELRTSFQTARGEVTAVDGVSFHVDQGEILGVVGESGCGKSVTAESIMRLLDEQITRYEGEVILDGQNLLELSERRMLALRGGALAMIFQDPMSSLNPVFTVGDQLVEGILLHQDISRRQARELAVRMLATTGIPSPERRIREYPHQLSGGMRQRVMIAMALTSRPRLLIADEPTTALDVTTQAQILELIEELREQFRMGTIFITHDLGVVAQVCDRVAVMYLGQIIETAPTGQLFDTPAHPYTRGLLAATPDVADESGQLYVIPGRVPTLHQVPAGCRFADRCAFVTDDCREHDPELRELRPGQLVRCLRAEEIERAGQRGGDGEARAARQVRDDGQARDDGQVRGAQEIEESGAET